MSFYRLFLKITASLLVGVVLLGALSSCAQSDGDADQTALEYSPEDIDGAILLDAYTGLEITLGGEDSSKSEAVWSYVLERAEVVSYPEAQVEYYAEQTRARYRYYAKQNGMDYGKVLDIVGITEEDILSDAKHMVKGDLVYRYIVKDAEIALTDTEKSELYDKYVDKYVSDFGYNRTYVTTYLTDHIYDSMLYDKTMEYLVLNNSFVVGGETQNE